MRTPEDETLSRQVEDVAPVLEAALNALKAGLCPVPVATDGTKRPALPSWKQYTRELPTPADLARWPNADEVGLGIVCGGISGRLEMLEVEGRFVDKLPEIQAAIEAAGLGDVFERVDAGYRERTPSGGIHWLYRLTSGDVEGNRKIAQRPAANGRDVLIETRGEGGFVVVAPTSGRCHPSGRPWQLERGGFASIAKVTPEERTELHRVLATFDEMPEAEPARVLERSRPSGSLEDDRPGDRFNRSTGWAEVLEPEGWQAVFTRGDVTYWRRPGKSTGISATTNALGTDTLKVFSTSTVFDTDRTYDRFGAVATLKHGGDLQTAARALRPATLKVDPSTGDIGPERVTERPALPEFPLDGWAPAYAAMVRAVAESTSTDPNMVATLALPVAGALIGNRRYVAVKDDWREWSRVFAVVVAPPSVGKSPVGRAVRAPLVAIQRDLDGVWRSQVEQWEFEGSKGRPPAPRHLVVHDTTVEALVEAMAGHPSGTLLYRDELTGWLASLDQYKARGGSDRQSYLEAWSGEPVRVVRVSKPALVVDNPHLSVAGTTQPGRLEGLLVTDDGFGQRFLVCSARPVRADMRAPAVPEPVAQAWVHLGCSLYRLPAPDGPVGLGFAPGVRSHLLDRLQALADLEHSGELAPVLVQVAGKLRAYLPRLTLINACMWAVSGSAEVVTSEMVDTAAEACEFFLGQARAVYGETDTAGVVPAPAHYVTLGPKAEEELIGALRRKHPRTLSDLLRKGPRSIRHAEPRRVLEMARGMVARGVITLNETETPRGISYVMDLP